MPLWGSISEWLWTPSPFSSVQLLSHVRLFATPWTAACQASLSITNSRACSITCPLSCWCHPTISSCVIPFSSHLQSFLSIRAFSNESLLHMRWPKYWSFSFSIRISNEYSVLISFRMDWLDLLAVRGTPKSLLQHHSSNPSILQHSAFFKVQLSLPYMTTGKTIALTRWKFVGKVMSLLFNMLSTLVIMFLPRRKHLLISCLQSPLQWFWNPKIKPLTVSSSICHKVMVPDAMILVFWMLSFKPTFSLSSFTFNKRLSSSYSFSVIRVSSAYLRFIDISPSNLDSSLCLFQPSVSHDVLCI